MDCKWGVTKTGEYWAANGRGRALPKFGEWDVNNAASSEGFTVIFNKARDQKKTSGTAVAAQRSDPNTTNQHLHHDYHSDHVDHPPKPTVNLQ
ncbi:hypothetical protein RND81_08G162600 [Saponaria officinalis]|uniref:RIN4 pathogenic type III effector avirulence factor Avr cleavage site domain-containing protein n=1 Tax=Saponaria officinalis TaxID=3572 RepID=A0AAW1J9K9_SAPOF